MINLHNQYLLIQGHTQCLFLGYQIDSKRRGGIPYSGYSLNCLKNIPLNKKILDSNGKPSGIQV